MNGLQLKLLMSSICSLAILRRCWLFTGAVFLWLALGGVAQAGMIVASQEYGGVEAATDSSAATPYRKALVGRRGEKEVPSVSDFLPGGAGAGSGDVVALSTSVFAILIPAQGVPPQVQEAGSIEVRSQFLPASPVYDRLRPPQRSLCAPTGI